MTSKGGSQQQVTYFYMSQHFGICSPVDKIKSITINEKVAWTGLVSTQSSFAISKEDLFGGPKKQGGVAGTVYFLPGAGTQVLPDNLAQKLGRANGADCPGYRGLASIFMTGLAGGQPGFYWTANDPYLPGVWVEVERAPVGLTPTYAMVPRAGTNNYPYSRNATSFGGIVPYQWAVSGDWLIRWNFGVVEFWSLASQTLVATVAASFPITGTYENVTVDDDGNAYVFGFHFGGDALTKISPNGTVVETAVSDSGHGTQPIRALTTSAGIKTFVGASLGYVEDTTWTSTTDAARDFCIDELGHVWAVFQPTGSSNTFSIVELVGGSTTSGSLTGLVPRGALSEARIAFCSSTGTFMVTMDGKFYIVNRSTWAITASGAAAWGTTDLPYNEPHTTTFWSFISEYSLVTGALIRTITPSDWFSSALGGQAIYDRVNNAIVSTSDGFVDWRFLDRGVLDANPAHIIYECLTNVDWGMGSPSSLIDVDAFNAAGETLFNDSFGLSMIWTRQSTIQDFVQEVLDHIQAVLFVDPQAGLLTLKLIRGDYDVGTLPEISPSTANLSNFGRKLWGDIVNEINVTWTNPTNEQDETVTAHDLASITTQGGIVSDSRNYYGVRYSDLAMRLAARDLRSAGAPLATCDAEVDRSFWSLRPASVLLVNWPEYGLADVVMRVTSIDYGKPGDPTIKLSLIEDVFGLDAADYISPPTTLWDEPAAVPTLVSESAVLTLPYFLATNGITNIAGSVYPEVLAGVLAASSNADTYGYELWSQVTLTDGTTEWQSIANLNLVGYGELSANLAAEATSTGVAFSSYVGTVAPQQAGFAIFGVGTEQTSELALITGASSTFDLSRGVLDTVPKAWASGTPVWFVTTDALIEDPTARSVAEAVDYRLLTRTSKGLLSLYAAADITATLTDRPWRPSRPANVTIGGVQFNTLATPVDMTGLSVVAVSWSNRNRTTEDSVVFGWTASTVSPETGQTTTIKALKTDGTTVLATHSALTGTTFNVPIASFGTEHIAIVEVSASRTDSDGTFASLQAQRIYVQLTAIAPAVDGASGIASASFAGAALAGSSSMSGAGSAVAGLVGSSVAGGGGPVGTEVYLTTPGDGSWTVPTGWTQVSVEMIAAGGNGALAASSSPGGGAGGGQYAKLATLGVTAGASINYHVGTPGGARGTSASPGAGDCWFSSASTIAYAQAGGPGVAAGAAGAGGSAAAVGSCTVNNGGNGAATSSAGWAGGGGAGSGGPTGVGKDGGAQGTLNPGHGGGGGGSNGGSSTIGAAGSASVGGGNGFGGNGTSGTGGATTLGGAGTAGGGGGGGSPGGGASGVSGGAGGVQLLWNSLYGPSGGGGGGANNSGASRVGGAGGTYGGGAGGNGFASSDALTPATGGQGIIVITRTA